jgi:hypothetical protein
MVVTVHTTKAIRMTIEPLRRCDEFLWPEQRTPSHVDVPAQAYRRAEIGT